MNHTEDPALRSFLAKRVNRPHLRFTIDGIKAMSRGISERQTSHKICQYEYIVFTVCCEGIYGRYCIEKSENNLSTFCHYPHQEDDDDDDDDDDDYYYYYHYTTKNSSAMAQTTPKIRSFSLANVSAKLSLKKLSFSKKKRN